MSTVYPSDAGIRPVDPVLSNIVGGLYNQEYLQDIVMPGIVAQVGLLPGMQGPVSGTILKHAVDAFYGDPSVNGTVGATEDVPFDKGAELTSVAYRAQSYARGTLIARDKMRALADLAEGDALKIKEGYLHRVMSVLRIVREKDVAALYFNDSNWQGGAADITPAVKWDQPTGNPVGDIQTAFAQVENFMRPNICILGRAAANNMRTNDTFLDFLPANMNRNLVNDETLVGILKNLFGFDMVKIGKSRYNTSMVPGTLTGADIWGDRVFVGHVAMNLDGTIGELGNAGIGGELEAHAASAVARVISAPWAVEEYDVPRKRSTALQVEYMEDNLEFQNQLGSLILATST